MAVINIVITGIIRFHCLDSCSGPAVSFTHLCFCITSTNFNSLKKAGNILVFL